MHMFLDLKHLVLCLQIHADTDVECLVLVGECLIVGILDVATSKLIPLVNVNILLDEVGIQIIDDEVFALQVDHRTLVAFLVNQHDRTDTCFLGHESIVGTKVGRDMNDTGTIVGCHVVARDDLKGIAHRLDGWHQLLVLHSHEVSTLIMSHNTIRNQFGTFLVGRQLTTVGDGSLGREIGIQTSLSQHNRDLVGAIGIIGLYGHIVDLRSYTEGRVGC